MHLNRCSTCREWHDQVHEIPVIGLVCTKCYRVLELPTLLEGVISGDPLLSSAKATQIEFSERTERLRLQAQQVVLAASRVGKSRFSVSGNPCGVVDENRPGMIVLLEPIVLAEAARRQMEIDGGEGWEWSELR